MKRLLLLLCLLCMPFAAVADDVPAQVQTMLEEYHGAGLPVEYIGFTLEDEQAFGIAIVDGYALNGFAFEEGQWRFTLMTSVMWQLRPAHLERLEGDVPAFDIVSEDGMSRLSYGFDGVEFRLVGWRLPGYPSVMVEGDRLIYDMDGHQTETILPGGVPEEFPWDAEDLPLTIRRAQELAVMTETMVADLCPGYTLRSYSSYNTGTAADAAYSRVKDGLLFIRRVALEAGMEPRWVDCLPVPLSHSLTARLESEPFDTLISCMSGGDTFLTQDAFDRVSLALAGNAVILSNTVQEESVIALVEEDGGRYVYIWEIAADAGVNGDGFHARRSLPLPEGASLDLFHAGDGEVQIEWAEQRYQASFRRTADGQWGLQWFGDAAEGTYIEACALGVWAQKGDESPQLRVGTMVGRDLFSGNLDALNAAEPHVDRTGWAVVSNPDPDDRLHLRVSPDKSSRSMGKFYNGTPLRVLGTKGEWTQVQLGLGSNARTGWMMTAYLAFGADMDAVAPAFPDLFFRDAYESSNPLGSGYWVAGVEGDEQYILLGHDGEVMYVPQAWLWEGNG